MRAQQIYVFVALIFVPNVENVIEMSNFTAFKCCGVYEQFDSSGKCVPAPWPPANVDFRMGDQHVVPATDESWVSRWFPPGPPRNRLLRKNGTVIHSLLKKSGMINPSSFSYSTFPDNIRLRDYSLRVSVNQSSFYSNAEVLRNWTRNMVLREEYLIRQKLGNNVREAYYCVDAVKGKAAPYLLVFRTLTTEKHGLIKCCQLGEVVVNERPGHLECDTDHRGWRNPINTSLSYEFDLETPFDVVSTMIKPVQNFMLTITHFHTLPLLPDDVQHIEYTRSYGVNFLSSSWFFPCVDLERDKKGDLSVVFGYFFYRRHTRGAYMISRYLPYVSTPLLFVALVVIRCKERMRSSAHGWALGSHVACLLFFNIGQIVFNLTMSHLIEKERKTFTQRDMCYVFAVFMHWLLTAANAWMLAVSANMYYGFRRTGGARAGGGDSRRTDKMFLSACIGAGGLTVISMFAHFIPVPENESETDVPMRPWYHPSFAETRTCYSDVGYPIIEPPDNHLQHRSQKLGTALYYYVPTLAMVAANCVFLCLTVRRVRYLRRGNSVLKRAEREGGGRRAGTGGGRQDEGSADDSNSVVVYIKLLLSGGVVEFLAELITWTVSRYDPLAQIPSEATKLHRMSPVWKVSAVLFADHSYAHRTVGYWADLFRALVVLLVLVGVPELRAFWRRMRGKGGDSPARGAATRPAPRHVARPAPPRAQGSRRAQSENRPSVCCQPLSGPLTSSSPPSQETTLPPHPRNERYPEK